MAIDPDRYTAPDAEPPVSITYHWSDGTTHSFVDKPGGIPDDARERALLRALLVHSLRQLDEQEHPMRTFRPASVTDGP